MKTLKRWAAWGVLGIGLILGACATTPEPFAYHPDNELKPGPGLFSGDDGVFTLYGKPPAAATATEDGGKGPGGSHPGATGAH
jgi:hypothetical protein